MYIYISYTPQSSIVQFQNLQLAHCGKTKRNKNLNNAAHREKQNLAHEASLSCKSQTLHHVYGCKEGCWYSFNRPNWCGDSGTQNRIHLKFFGAGSIDTTHNFTGNIMGWVASHSPTLCSKSTSALKHTPPNKKHASPVVPLHDSFFCIGDLLPPSPKPMGHHRNSLNKYVLKRKNKTTTTPFLNVLTKC